MYVNDKGPANSDEAYTRLHALSARTHSTALGYVIETLALTWLKGYSRIDAQHEVAHRHNITISTVMDKFSHRRGGVRAEELDKILDDGNVADLDRFLRRLFKSDPACNDVIRQAVLTLKPHKRAQVFPRAFLHLTESKIEELVQLLIGRVPLE